MGSDGRGVRKQQLLWVGRLFHVRYTFLATPQITAVANAANNESNSAGGIICLL